MELKPYNSNLKNVVYDNNFLYISQKIDFEQDQQIALNFKDLKVIIVNYYETQSSNNPDGYFIFGFKKKIIIINQSKIELIHCLLSYNENIEFFSIKHERNF